MRFEVTTEGTTIVWSNNQQQLMGKQSPRGITKATSVVTIRGTLVVTAEETQVVTVIGTSVTIITHS